MMRSTASRPDIPGSSMSIVTRSGVSRPTAAIASSAERADGDDVELAVVLDHALERRGVRPRVLADEDARPRASASRADQPGDGLEQRVLVEAVLDHVGVGAGLDTSPAVLVARRAR